jgi:hypothetical protein
MLACQFLVVMMATVKRIDAVVLHAWWSGRDAVKSVPGLWSDGEADCG